MKIYDRNYMGQKNPLKDMQPIRKQKIYPLDKQWHTSHYRISECGAESYHQEDDANFGDDSNGAAVFYWEEEISKRADYAY